MNDTAGEGSRRPVARIRRILIVMIVVSFGLAALGGIVVLLGAEWSETTGKVLTTTVVVGIASVAALCCAALIGRRAQWFGMFGESVTVAATVVALWQIWADDAWSQTSFRALLTLCAAAALSALASLLLLLADHRQRAVRLGLIATLALLAVGFVLLLWSIWGWLSSGAIETYWRVSGVLWILAALGVVILPVLSLLLRRRPDAPPTVGPAQLSASTWEELLEQAARAGVSPDEIVRRLLAGAALRSGPPNDPTASPAPAPPQPNA